MLSMRPGVARGKSRREPENGTRRAGVLAAAMSDGQAWHRTGDLPSLRYTSPFGAGYLLSATPSIVGIRDSRVMVQASILTDDFAQAASQTGLRARQAAFAAGHAVVFVDAVGRCVEEWPEREVVRFPQP
jgi:hypothetical protein